MTLAREAARFETFRCKSPPGIRVRSGRAIANGGVKEKGCGPTTESLQANYWLPPLTNVVAGRKMLPFRLNQTCLYLRYGFVLIDLAILLET